MDSIGSFYYTKESFDETYPGYGSTYSDLQGGLALLFEQASSRGHVQETNYGEMTFGFTIRNQFLNGIATVEAAVDNKVLLRDYQKRFFENLPNLSDNKTQIIYHSIDPIRKNTKKNKQIIFVGKLNESKGYDLYCKSMFKILDQYSEWRAISIGEERRFQNFPTHKRHFNLGQIPHNKVLDYLSKSEIAVIPSRWEEPFGRTALEASSRGCATIISNTGGLPETTDYAIKLKKLDTKNIENEIIKLIKNDKLRKRIQIKSKNFVKHKLKINSQKIFDKIIMLLFVGLGNPDPKHKNNRHNIGFMLIDALNKKFNFSTTSIPFFNRKE